MATKRGKPEKRASGTTPRCPVCRRPLRRKPRGRPPRYCSSAHRQVAYRERKGERRKRRLVRLCEGDARELLRSLPDESIDLIVTDPPYVFERGGRYFRHWFPDVADDEWPPILVEL